jgi:hypothetical protein
MQRIAIETFTCLTHNTESTFIHRNFLLLIFNLTFNQLLCCIITVYYFVWHTLPDDDQMCTSETCRTNLNVWTSAMSWNLNSPLKVSKFHTAGFLDLVYSQVFRKKNTFFFKLEFKLTFFWDIGMWWSCGDHEHLRPVTVITAFASVLRWNVLETPADSPVYIFID